MQTNHLKAVDSSFHQDIQYCYNSKISSTGEQNLWLFATWNYFKFKVGSWLKRQETSKI